MDRAANKKRSGAGLAAATSSAPHQCPAKRSARPVVLRASEITWRLLEEAMQ